MIAEVLPNPSIVEAGEASAFTGQIAKVTIELKPGKPLDKAEADRLEENQELEQQHWPGP